METVCCAVLDKICSLAAFGRYVIFSEDELFEAFPDGTERDFGELKKALKALVNAGYIDLKYSGGDLYCIAPLKKYEPEPEPLPAPAEEVEDKPEENVKKSFPFSPFFAAFAGGALGSFIISLAFAVLQYA
ncbi:MAG: hypothetical protein K2L42_00270 [Clostridia bacterium]|nr:hypothetical protein [Clostridia bacterium]